MRLRFRPGVVLGQLALLDDPVVEPLLVCVLVRELWRVGSDDGGLAKDSWLHQRLCLFLPRYLAGDYALSIATIRLFELRA